MTKLEKYPSYKNSDIEWLGDIPEHWKIEKFKYLFKENSIKNHANEEPLAATQLYGVVPKNSLDFRTVEANVSDLNTFKLVNKHNFVISLRSFEGGIEYSLHRGIISPAYTILESINNINYKYFKFLFKSNIFIQALNIYKTGIREGQNISFQKLKDDFLSIPPLQEQEKIVEYLDKKTSQIDEAISQKQKLIELLKERKQIVINEAVTRGIFGGGAIAPQNSKNEESGAKAPPPEMIDSGIEWIGKIPKHWEVKKLKHLLKINNGQDYKEVLADSGYPVIGSGGQFAYANKFLYDGEVLLLGRKGTIDKPLYFKGKFWTVDTMFYAIPKNNSVIKFLYYSSLLIPFRFYSTSTALPSMTQFDLNNHFIALPPKTEQLQIVEYIDNQISKIDKAIELEQNYIEKLKEYKATLIDSVVTGKVRVC